jgi:hypothetical protein
MDHKKEFKKIFTWDPTNPENHTVFGYPNYIVRFANWLISFNSWIIFVVILITIFPWLFLMNVWYVLIAMILHFIFGHGNEGTEVIHAEEEHISIEDPGKVVISKTDGSTEVINNAKTVKTDSPAKIEEIVKKEVITTA